MDELIAKYFEYLNAENWDGLASVFTDDATYQATGSRPRAGRDDVMTFFRTAFTAWDVHVDTPVNVMLGEDSAAVEVAFNGTRRTDGREINFDAVDVFHFRDGQVATASTWYDLNWVRGLLAA